MHYLFAKESMNLRKRRDNKLNGGSYGIFSFIVLLRGCERRIRASVPLNSRAL